MNKFMRMALEEAKSNLWLNHGGPFGCVIVKDGKFVSSAHNEVIRNNDPTAHAEILAIRKAGEVLNNFNLSGCELYSSCEPCPMCFSAIYWSRIDKVYYSASRADASGVGFDDEAIYHVLSGKTDNRRFRLMRMNEKEGAELFREFINKPDKTIY